MGGRANQSSQRLDCVWRSRSNRTRRSVATSCGRLQSTTQPTSAPAVAEAPAARAGVDDGKSLGERLLDSERREIMAAIEKSGGNIASASRTLGINRSTLYYRLRKHDLEHLLPTKIVVGSDEIATGDSDP